jgi:hypothetical protein
VSAQPNPSLSLAATHMHVLKHTKYITCEVARVFHARSLVYHAVPVRACALAAAEQPRRTSKAGTARYRMPTAHIPCSDCLPRPDPSIRTRATTGMATAPIHARSVGMTCKLIDHRGKATATFFDFAPPFISAE